MSTALDSTQTQLITDVARDLVPQTAPEERPLFRATSTAYFRHPNKALRDHAGDVERLGFSAESGGWGAGADPMVADSGMPAAYEEVRQLNFPEALPDQLAGPIVAALAVAPA